MLLFLLLCIAIEGLRKVKEAEKEEVCNLVRYTGVAAADQTGCQAPSFAT